MMAGEIKIGDVVEFEVGSPVRVREIDDNWGESQDPHLYQLKYYGKSLIFSCEFVGVEADAVQTLYVRRERSPLSGAYVVR